ncbi:uncharacterized protein LOC116801237 [Drosophila sechellia]|uniref:Uncharacterized protein LOC117140173 n=1 Tax=Drosophila mauritiana TaxID=7226 RepID=A0A6P8K788_DROMA|nr:uncharacterized protein LOC116801237 [Drosophila sechellia]XP_033158841.1 uncharacterized protein LOC117140173 [Drosophila mauritiana]
MTMELLALHNLQKVEQLTTFDLKYFFIIYAIVVLMILGVPLAFLLQSKGSPNERDRFQLEANRTRGDPVRGEVRRRIRDSSA